MKKIHILVIFVVCAALFVACSSKEDNFLAGPDAPADNVGAYIANDYSTQNIYGEQPVSDTIWINVVRTKTSNAIDIPIIVDEADTAIHIPSVVSFAAGQDTVKVPITSKYIQISKTYNVSMHLDETYCNPYADVEGGPSADFIITWATWEPLTNETLYQQAVADGLLKYSADSTLVLDSVLYYTNGYVGGKIEHIKGLNRFRITDFYGSGIPLDFSLSNFNADEPAESTGKITINGNTYAEATAYGTSYAWGKTGWESWTPTGYGSQVSAIYFYPEYNNSAYNNINLNLNKPKTYSFKSKPGVKYLCEGNDDYYGIELMVINGGWCYAYFYVYYCLKAKADLE